MQIAYRKCNLAKMFKIIWHSEEIYHVQTPPLWIGQVVHVPEVMVEGGHHLPNVASPQQTTCDVINHEPSRKTAANS